MTNWQTFKIIEASVVSGVHFKVRVDRDIDYKDGRNSYIWFPKRSPYSNYRAGDYLEVDLDRICHCYYLLDIDDSGIVRRASSSTNIITTRGSSSNIVVSPSAANFIASQDGLNLARGMSRMVDETGKSFEYKIEVENKDGKKISHSLICRRD